MSIKIGIALLNNRIETAVVAKSRHGWKLIKNFTLPVEDNLAQTIPLLKNKLQHFSRSQINLGIHYTQVLIKEMKLDNCLSPKQVFFYIKQNAMHLLGKPFEHWLIDFEKYSQNVYKICAVPRENIYQLLAILKNGGLKIKSLLVDVFAVSRLSSTFQTYQPEHYLGIVCVNDFEILLIVCHNRQLIYYKKTICNHQQEIPVAIASLVQFYNTFLPDKPLNQLLFNRNWDHSEIDLGFKLIHLHDDIWPNASKNPAVPELISLGLSVYDH